MDEAQMQQRRALARRVAAWALNPPIEDPRIERAEDKREPDPDEWDRRY